MQFWYEYQDAHDGMKWKRCYGLEDWTFAEDGKMRKRQMSGNDIEISEAGRSISRHAVVPDPRLLITSIDFGLVSQSTFADASTDRWFKDGVDVNSVEISEAHW